jgi:uncharacterized protein (DUF736 family)
MPPRAQISPPYGSSRAKFGSRLASSASLWPSVRTAYAVPNDHRNHPEGVKNMTMTNFIQFTADDIDTATGSGLISTIDRDLDIKVTPFDSANENAPTHRVYAKSPRGHDIEIGGIWKKLNAEKRPYYQLSIKRLGFNANLGRYPGQDDIALQAIIEWEPRA